MLLLESNYGDREVDLVVFDLPTVNLVGVFIFYDFLVPAFNLPAGIVYR